MSAMPQNIFFIIIASFFFSQCKEEVNGELLSKEYINNNGRLIELNSDGTWKVSDSILYVSTKAIMPAVLILDGQKSRVDIFYKFLEKAKEPIIKKDSVNWKHGSFRIIRTESFDPIQTITRIICTGDSVSIIRKEIEATRTKNDSDFEIEIKSTKVKTLSIRQWEEIVNLARNSLFWDINNFTLLSGADGTRFIIEGAGNFNYNIINTREPKEGCLQELVTAIEKLGK